MSERPWEATISFSPRTQDKAEEVVAALNTILGDTGSVSPPKETTQLPPVILSQVFDSPFGDAGVSFEEAAYCVTRSRPGYALIYRWLDLTDPTSFSYAKFPFGFSAESAAAGKEVIYVGPNITVEGEQWQATIKTVDANLEIGDYIERAPVGTPGCEVGSNTCIACDEEHVFLLLTSQDENSWVYKYRCSDGQEVASLRLASTHRGTYTRRGMAIGLDEDHVFVAGGGGRIWAAKLPKDLSWSYAIDVDLGLCNDDLRVTGDSFWIGSERQPRVYRVAKDMSGAVAIDTGAGTQGMDGFALDDKHLFVGHNGNGAEAATVVALDLSSNAVVGRYDLAPGQLRINELWRAPGGIFLTTLEPQGKAIYLPTPDL